jgi:uncharacterized membrane-anchored protein YhcB (DUF1043 family)
MTGFTLDQWVIVILVFVLGLFIGMYMLAGGKWKRRYREEVRRREEMERENSRLLAESREMNSLRGAATKDRLRDRDPL